MKYVCTFLSSITDNWKLLLLASLPALALTAFGLHQLEVNGWAVWTLALAVRLAVEFTFLGLCLALLNACGLKNKWILAVLLYLYYISMTADFVLLWYFKERFGAKYLDTLQGGDYDFLTDWRILSYLIVVFVFCIGLVHNTFTAPTRRQACRKICVCAVLLAIIWLLHPLAMLPKPADFLTHYLLPPSPVYTGYELVAPRLQPIITPHLSEQTAQLAENYQVFSAKDTPVGKKYKRVIFIATESLSAKYMHRFNPLIPPAASAAYDQLFEQFPATTLHTVTLSTLYGLSVIFSSHPYAELSYENGYPISFVRELKKNGFHTAFLRGAIENYMDENMLFHQAGFDVVRGRHFFEQQPAYADFIDWWGLTDRKLFEYATTYLQENKDKQTFITLLTVDTHVPLGRSDYLGLPYEEIDEPFYNMPTMPRAYSHASQDLAYFLRLLQEKNLLDDDTVIFVTGDHPSYSNTPTNQLFKPYQRVFDRIPFWIITRQAIRTPLTENTLASQLDIAPTVLDVLHLPQPKGFFGHSLFDTQATRAVFDIKEDYAVITTPAGQRIVPLNSRKPNDRAVIDLMRTFWVE